MQSPAHPCGDVRGVNRDAAAVCSPVAQVREALRDLCAHRAPLDQPAEAYDEAVDVVGAWGEPAEPSTTRLSHGPRRARAPRWSRWTAVTRLSTSPPAYTAKPLARDSGRLASVARGRYTRLPVRPVTAWGGTDRLRTPLGCKRVPLDSGYFETFNHDTCTWSTCGPPPSPRSPRRRAARRWLGARVRRHRLRHGLRRR